MTLTKHLDSTETDLDVVRRFAQDTPVNLPALISQLGIDYIVSPLESGVSGAIEYEPNGFRIFVNSNESQQRQRFTAAHELGHYLLHRDLLRAEGKLNRHSDRLFGDNAQLNPVAPFSPQHEIQANKYAAQILMPKSAIESTYNHGSDNFAELAKTFSVSPLAMKIRLNNLGLRGPVEAQ